MAGSNISVPNYTGAGAVTLSTPANDVAGNSVPMHTAGVVVGGIAKPVGDGQSMPVADAAAEAALTAIATSVAAGATAAGLLAVVAAIKSVLTVNPFTPIPGATTTLSAGPTATAQPVALPANTASAYRIRNAASSATPVAWRLNVTNSTATGSAPVAPTAYTTAGTGGTVGDKMIDPGGVELFALTPTQITALAAGSLFFSAVTPAGGSATVSVTPGVAGV